MLHAVVMAGGAGTRFWPESRARRPKQLLALGAGRSLLADTVGRLGSLVPAERVLVVTAAGLVSSVRSELPELPADSILGEPCKRDTAPCIGLAALWTLRRDPEATLAVMPSDHVIESPLVFQQALGQAAQLVAADPARFVTFGIRPTYPAETFGYIERGEPLPSSSGRRATDVSAVYRVARFREKPRAEVAQEYLSSGRYYWNSGIFVWRARAILAALTAAQPAMVEHLERIAAAAEKPEFAEVFAREFAAIRGLSIDYAVMESYPQVVVIEAPFRWDDVGSWQAMARIRGADGAGNTVVGRHLGLNTRGSIVRTSDEHLVVTLGVNDLIVVHTPDATLVANKHDEESIRELVKQLDERGWREYL